MAPKGGPADSGALTNWLAPHSKIPSAATDPRPERAHPRTERAYPMFEKTILRLRVYLRPDMPISGLRISFARLRRSIVGLRSNLVHSSLRRV